MNTVKKPFQVFTHHSASGVTTRVFDTWIEAMDKACKLREKAIMYLTGVEPAIQQIRFAIVEIKEAHKILSWEEFQDSTKA